MAIMKNTPKVLQRPGMTWTTVLNHTIDAFSAVAGFEALGMYLYLSQKPAGWVINEEHLMTYSKRGRDYVRRCMAQIASVGLIKRECVRNKKGKITHWNILLFNEPQQIHITENLSSGDDHHITENPTEAEMPLKPKSGKAFDAVHHITEKQPPINKDINKEKNISKPFSNSDMLSDNPHGFKMEDIDELQANRKRKRASPLTKRSWDRINRQLTLIVETCSITAYEAIDKMLSHSWLSIDVSYFKPASRTFKSVESNNNPPLENKDDLDDDSTIFLFSEEPDSLEEIKIQIEGCMKIIRNNLPLLCVEIAEKRIVSLNLKLSNLTQ